MRGLVDEAPEWYKERRVEIRGEGYPEIGSVPTIDAGSRPGQTLGAERRVIGEAELAFLTHSRAEPSETTPADILRWRNDQLAAFEPVSTPPDILTAEEIRALRSVFDKYVIGG